MALPTVPNAWISSGGERDSGPGLLVLAFSGTPNVVPPQLVVGTQVWIRAASDPTANGGPFTLVGVTGTAQGFTVNIAQPGADINPGLVATMIMREPLSASAYYLTLITSEYQLTVEYKAWLQAFLQIVSEINACADSLVPAFDLDIAVGVQLDILGQIVGVTRQVTFQVVYGNLPAFGFDLNNASVAGFDTGFWSGLTTPILDDATFRILIKAKIAQNSWDGQISSIAPIWQTLFPGGSIIVQDNQNMTATVFLAGTFTTILQDLIINGLIVPRPEGVMYTYVFAKLPIFGFDQNNTFSAGFDTGFWAI